ncbi:MAG: NTP transferase domain-containing protein [Clostridiales bacterium]|nr:NTP transferase domain-containing protein [Clostridiales bacterium]
MTDEIREKYVGLVSMSVLDAMRKIDANGKGILILVNEEGKLAGTLTDGDIRRFFLSGGKTDELCSKACNAHPHYAGSYNEAVKIYREMNFVAVPIVTKDLILSDIFLGNIDTRVYPKLNIPVVINAGGKGTRLEPFTKILPKPLIPVGEYPIIQHIINRFSRYGCTEFHIIVNYKKQLIKAYFSELDEKYNISWYDEDEPLGTGGGLSLLKGQINSTFFFTSCDTLIDTNYDSLLQFHRKTGDCVTMICANKNIEIPYGVVEIGENGRIENMKEKPVVSFMTNTGMYLVEPDILEHIPEGKKIGFPDVVESERASGRTVSVFPVSENDWMDMGQFSELEKMRLKLYGE